MIQVQVKEYKKASDYQEDAILQTLLGWEIVDGADHRRGWHSKAKFVVTYRMDDSVVVELPLIPEGLGYWKKLQWFGANKPAGIGRGLAYVHWQQAVAKHTKEVRG